MSERDFDGIIGRTMSESRPWWPKPVRTPEGSPNVLFIVFDDVGFADFGCYGSEISTPTIDGLAAGGLRYTNFHTTSLCSPTRTCLLTGRNHHSAGMAALASWDTGFPGARGRVSRSAGTLGEMLRPVGYRTYALGKWHLTATEETSAAGPYDQWPLARGFDRFYGFMDGETNQWKPELVYDNHRIEPPDRPDYHLTEDLVDRAIEFVRDQKSVTPETPFLLYLGLGACHAPHHVPGPFVDKYVPVFEKGWDQTREDRLARQKAMGLVPGETELPPRNIGVRPWDELPPDERKLSVRLQAAYAGMLDHADVHLGRLRDFLLSIGEWENTLVVLLSDNGASQEGSPYGTVNAMKYFNRVYDDVPSSLKHLDEIGEAHTNCNYPTGWAMASNTPLKRYKQTAHGGGVRDPLIIHWPQRITDRGGIRHQFHHVVDIVPTVLELLGLKAPSAIGGVAQKPIEGTSLAYTFDDSRAPTRKEVQYFEVYGCRGIWYRGWKAVAWHRAGQPFERDRWELYQLERDFAEMHDLAEAEPERLRAMIERWWVEAGKYQVLPLDDRTSQRWAVTSGTSLRDRKRSVYYCGMAHLPSDAAPDIRNRSYAITAEVEIPTQGAEGVLIAWGDWCSGFSFYVKDGCLVHDYNYVGTHTEVRSSIRVPTGKATLRFEFRKTGNYRGIGKLLVNGVPAGEAAIPKTLLTIVSWEGLDVGRDSLVPVGDYEAPFDFTGLCHRVIVDLGDDQNIDPDATQDAALARQ